MFHDTHTRRRRRLTHYVMQTTVYSSTYLINTFPTLSTLVNCIQHLCHILDIHGRLELDVAAVSSNRHLGFAGSKFCAVICLYGMAPPYLTSYCTPVSARTLRSNLRSATTGQLVVPRTGTVYGSCSFAVHGPVVWNRLPAELRSPDMTRGVFRKQLKTFLFNCQ